MDNKNLRIIFAGDLVSPHIDDFSVIPVSGIPDLLSTTDIAVINLECPLTQHARPITKTGPSLKAPPEAAYFVRNLGFSVATLANNHILDQGPVGVLESIRNCREAGLQTVGAGKNLEDARKALILEIKGYGIAILNYCEREFSIAGAESPGANPFDLIDCLNDLEAVRKNSDLIILVIHGGIEHYPLPSPERRRTYRFLAEQPGVCAIISHHTHCPSAYEIWEEVPIFYGLGNFLFHRPEVSYAQWHDGYLVELQLSGGEISGMHIHPYSQSERQPGIRLLDGTERDYFMSELKALNDVLGDSSFFKDEWRKFLASRKDYYRSNMLGLNRYVGFVARKLPFLFHLFGTRNQKVILNLMRCDAHREALIELLRERG